VLPGEGRGGLGGRALAAVLAVLACMLVAAPPASAELFNVDNTGDQPDSIPGDEVCETATEECTLRAAIEEANSTESPDEIVFEEGVFEGQAAATIALGASLPAIVGPVAINGKECATASGVEGPCVGVEGPSGAPALIVDHKGVAIFGLAVTGAQTGIDVEGSTGFKAQADWFGVGLDGSADADGTGILLGPGSDNGRIGGEGPEARDVFAGNSPGVGLDIHGASGTKVLGDYFGVGPDGTAALANGKDVEVSSVSGGGPEASGTAIGTRLSAKAAASANCDGGCNVISGSASSGIDLQGGGGEEAPAVATTILGNDIGLDAEGAAAIPNAAADVLAGEAAQTVVGGVKAGEANLIDGGTAAILAGPAAADLLVRGNRVGLGPAGTETLAPPDEGIVVDSEGLSSLAVEAIVAGNEIGMEGGVGIDQEGFGATIAGNRISGAADGIRTRGPTERHGNLIEGNSVEELEGVGIAVENDLNEVLGNEVDGAEGAGISIDGTPPFGVTGNLIGGDAAAAENAISGVAGDAIEISDVEASENEVARNRGFANSGLFIHLVAAGAEPKWPNLGIEPPAFAGATQTGASGNGAKVGARVRVFRKQLAASGELQSFLGEATVDSGGDWEVSYDEAIPAGTIVAATQTSEAGGTSELATATTAGEAGGGAGTGGGGGGPAVAGPPKPPPQTTIVSRSGTRSRSGAVRFAFTSDAPGATFQCKLDGGPFRPCRSPKRYGGLKPGRHRFEVRAVDPAGGVDPSPARRAFTVLAGRKGRRR
jgi:Right handed beta helix region